MLAARMEVLVLLCLSHFLFICHHMFGIYFHFLLRSQFITLQGRWRTPCGKCWPIKNWSTWASKQLHCVWSALATLFVAYFFFIKLFNNYFCTFWFKTWFLERELIQLICLESLPTSNWSRSCTRLALEQYSADSAANLITLTSPRTQLLTRDNANFQRRLQPRQRCAALANLRSDWLLSARLPTHRTRTTGLTRFISNVFLGNCM